jgi:hypothetical protein
MTSYQVTESEIIDVLLGQAGAEVEEEVRRAVRSSKEFAATCHYWARIVPVMKQENVRAKAVTRRACQKLMARLNVDAESKLTVPLSWKNGTRFRWIEVAAVAACVVLCASFLVTLVYRGHESSMVEPAREGAMLTLERAISYVDFSYNRAHGRGTLSQPFKTLAEGIDTVSDGGTVRIRGDATFTSTAETLRISRPVRLEAAGGNVRIGDSEA